MSYLSKKVVYFPSQDFVDLFMEYSFITVINRLKCLLSDYFVLQQYWKTPTRKTTHKIWFL